MAAKPSATTPSIKIPSQRKAISWATTWRSVPTEIKSSRHGRTRPQTPKKPAGQRRHGRSCGWERRTLIRYRQKAKPLHHGGTESRRKHKDRWVCFGPQGIRSLQQGFRYFGTLSPSGRRRHGIRARILPVTRGVWVFSWPHFSDTGTISKYQYSALAGSASIGRAEEDPFIFAILRVSVTPWCKGFVLEAL